MRPSREPLSTPAALAALTAALLPTLALLPGCAPPSPGDPQGPLGTQESGLHAACAPAETVPGIDISAYQHPGGAAIDWAAVSAEKKFVIIKVTEGTGYVNPYYDDDAAQARAHGMIVGAYHFLRSNSDGTAQADHMIAAMGGNVPQGDLPPMADVEDTDDCCSPAQRAQVVHDFIARLEQVTGRKPMIYSGSWYWGPYLGGPGGYGTGYPKVWSWYRTDCPQVPDDFDGIAFWQYLGDDGRTAGIQAACDQDVFYGSLADLQALARGRAPDFAGQSLGREGQSYPIVADAAVTVHVGETVTGWVKLKNTGGLAWQPGTVFLAPIPRDQESPYQSPSWVSPTRISTVDQEVPPGEVGQFQLDLTGHQVGEAVLDLGWVAEGQIWFADSGGPADGYFAVKVDVIEGPAPATDGGPVDDGGTVTPPPLPPPRDGGPTPGADLGSTPPPAADGGPALTPPGRDVAGGCTVSASAPAAGSGQALVLLLGLGLLLRARRRTG